MPRLGSAAVVGVGGGGGRRVFMEFSLPKALNMPSLGFLQFFLLYVFISQVACCHTSWKVRSEPKRRDMEGRGPDCRQASHRQEGVPGGCSPGGPASSGRSDQPRGNAHYMTSSLWFWLVSPMTAKRPGPRVQAGGQVLTTAQNTPTKTRRSDRHWSTS